MDQAIRPSEHNVRHNLFVNVMDGAFFGLGIGFGSFVTMLPLFVSQLTTSAILIGLVPAVHAVGWQLPQLWTVNHVSRLARYKPTVLWMTVHERVPFLGLAAVAWFLPVLGKEWTLVLVFAMLIWQGLGAGVTATPWQAMIGKIMPPTRVGTFFGLQASAANLTSSFSAIGAGLILERVFMPGNFALCFLLSALCMVVSYWFLAQTREPATEPAGGVAQGRAFWNMLYDILRRDRNFTWFLVARILSTISTMAFAFYIVYAVRQYNMSVAEAGVMTAVYGGTQIAANPILGWLADHWSPRAALELGAVAAFASALCAWFAPAPEWFYLVFVLAGIANVALWTIGLTLILVYSPEGERPAYIGLANTLVAPATILAPLFGGWLADTFGFGTTFAVSAATGLLTALVIQLTLRDPPRPSVKLLL